MHSIYYLLAIVNVVKFPIYVCISATNSLSTHVLFLLQDSSIYCLIVSLPNIFQSAFGMMNKPWTTIKCHICHVMGKHLPGFLVFRLSIAYSILWHVGTKIGCFSGGGIPSPSHTCVCAYMSTGIIL